MIRCKRRKDIIKTPTEDEALKNIMTQARAEGMNFRRYIMQTATLAEFRINIKPVQLMFRPYRFQFIEPGKLTLRPVLGLEFLD